MTYYLDIFSEINKLTKAIFCIRYQISLLLEVRRVLLYLENEILSKFDGKTSITKDDSPIFSSEKISSSSFSSLSVCINYIQYLLERYSLITSFDLKYVDYIEQYFNLPCFSSIFSKNQQKIGKPFGSSSVFKRNQDSFKIHSSSSLPSFEQNSPSISEISSTQRYNIENESENDCPSISKEDDKDDANFNSRNQSISQSPHTVGISRSIQEGYKLSLKSSSSPAVAPKLYLPSSFIPNLSSSLSNTLQTPAPLSFSYSSYFPNVCLSYSSNTNPSVTSCIHHLQSLHLIITIHRSFLHLYIYIHKNILKMRETVGEILVLLEGVVKAGGIAASSSVMRVLLSFPDLFVNDSLVKDPPSTKEVLRNDGDRNVSLSACGEEKENEELDTKVVTQRMYPPSLHPFYLRLMTGFSQAIDEKCQILVNMEVKRGTEDVSLDVGGGEMDESTEGGGNAGDEARSSVLMMRRKGKMPVLKERNKSFKDVEKCVNEEKTLFDVNNDEEESSLFSKLEKLKRKKNEEVK
jgi:hypothetical protein